MKTLDCSGLQAEAEPDTMEVPEVEEEAPGSMGEWWAHGGYFGQAQNMSQLWSFHDVILCLMLRDQVVQNLVGVQSRLAFHITTYNQKV